MLLLRKLIKLFKNKVEVAYLKYILLTQKRSNYKNKNICFLK